jgi:hypothetical protein
MCLPRHRMHRRVSGFAVVIWQRLVSVLEFNAEYQTINYHIVEQLLRSACNSDKY